MVVIIPRIAFLKAACKAMHQLEGEVVVLVVCIADDLVVNAGSRHVGRTVARRAD